MMEDQQDNADTESTEQEADATETQDSTPEEQVVDTDESTDTPSEEEPAEDKEDKLYAGKFKSPDDMEKSYKELEGHLGNYKEVQEKAQAYEQLSKQKRVSGAPKWQDFQLEDGTLDAPSYEQATAQYYAMTSGETARTAAREEVDLDRVYRDFPYAKDDPDVADAIVSMYRSGRGKTLYEAAQRIDKLRTSQSSQAEKIGAQKKEKELAQKTRSFSEKAGAKSNEGMTQEAFSKLSLSEKEAYVNKNWGDRQIT